MTPTLEYTTIKILYFNPHSREGSDYRIRCEPYYINISIHTPAKGVTGTIHTILNYQAISIHTPAKGVTVIAALEEY